MSAFRKRFQNREGCSKFPGFNFLNEPPVNCGLLSKILLGEAQQRPVFGNVLPQASTMVLRERVQY